ncbi:zinc-binding dehydrogenase [Streptomyces collinus]|uniref:2-deoxy-scyllo-inosamine dehydrogenase n=1 Tax=Streptomyces collinus TaxID=42684 RepID=A0AA89QAV7_STRCU|nr:zinc-binding dehydrogenase [Streptomyces collinus]MBB5812735.1 propanol-preferring alcohol dehydrogenase [Streptomyces collinus]WMX65869.1 zinc-binding dehydrogenase [Streptomyces collinus]
MQSWRFNGTGKPLVLEEVEVPHAGPGEVVVDIKAAGLCHSDVSALDDPEWMASFPRLPMTLGHGNAGVISEVVPGMGHWRVGDRVGLAPLMPDGDAIGYGAWDGGYGPKVRATDANLVRLPNELSFERGAMATDAGLTSYHAMVTRGGAQAGMRIGVIGLGGLGYIGARIAVLLGAQVYAADVNPATRLLADEIGLAGVAESITEFTDKDLQLIVDYAGFGTTTAQAVETLAASGTLVQVGLGRTQSTVDTKTIVFKQLQILGSLSGTQQDLTELYALMRGGDLNPPINRITPDEIPDGLERLRKGGVVGRIIARYEN